MTATDDGLWLTIGMSRADDPALVRIDPATNAITASLGGAGGVDVITAGSLLIGSAEAGVIAVVDPATASVVTSFNAHAAGAPSDRSSIAWDGRLLWQFLPNADYRFHGGLIAIDLGRYSPAG